VRITCTLFFQAFEALGKLNKDKWVKNVLEFLYKNRIEIQDTGADVTMCREIDKTITSILEAVENNALIIKTEWKTANKCRKYLKVVIKGDIATRDERYVMENMLTCKASETNLRIIE